jgi:hypothetical protein
MVIPVHDLPIAEKWSVASRRIFILGKIMVSSSE